MLNKKNFGIKVVCLTLIMAILLSGCQKEDVDKKIEPKGKSYFAYFDTVSYIFDYRGDDNEKFDSLCDGVIDVLLVYHKLFDIYHEYDGVVNLCTLNKNAGKQPLEVDPLLVDFLLYCKEVYKDTNGKMNIMMGAVLSIWHQARETATNNPESAYLPSETELQTASLHTSIDLLVIDSENNTVFISDPDASIDVGAIGKGYATERAADYLFDQKAYGYVLNIGGNIRIIGTRPNGDGWTTGIKNPHDTDNFALKIYISDTACVTSGNYERFFVYEGVKYHHIIDAETLQPAKNFSSITIITDDSGLADALSTALFCMSYEEGYELIQSLDEKVDVIWIDPNGEIKYTDGVKDMIIE